MTDSLHLLIQLQGIDSKRNQQKEQERLFDEKLKEAERTLEKAKNEFEQFRLKKTQLEKKKHDKELELKIHEDGIIKLKDKGTKLKTNEEYQAHTKEVEAAYAKRGEHEEALLILMEEEDQIKKEGGIKEKDLTAAKQTFEKTQQAIQQERNQFAEDAQGFDKEWAELSEKVDAPLLDRYKRLLSVGRGLAIIPLSGNTCTGCHFSLPPQQVAEVKIGDKLSTCTYCHRILYAVAQPAQSG